ncbi:MAG: hypothetical protein R2773_01465 [Flavobacteriaceae bacterium]
MEFRCLRTFVHLLAKMERKHSEDYQVTPLTRLSKKSQQNILENLFGTIKKPKTQESFGMGNYYTKTNYDASAFEGPKSK